MPERILVTGGAGFIGSHIVDALIAKGHEVVIYDCLHPQVHGPGRAKPDYLNPRARFVPGDVRDYEAFAAVLRDADVVFHEAAAVGVGQSMYMIREYCEANVMGTANLLHFIANEKHTVRKMIVASSMSTYGEGKYRCPSCGDFCPPLRTEEQLRTRRWEMICPVCGADAVPVPTDETKPQNPTSVYAVTKRDQEELVLSTGFAYHVPAVALRYFNAYGPRQSLSNPYNGVCAIFASRILNNRPPVIWEDGGQSRDFVHISDIVQANLLAMEKPEADYQAFNVGTGRAVSIRAVAEKLAAALGRDVAPEFPGKFRAGDIRHCFADITKISRVLGYRPALDFDAGIPVLIEWAARQTPEDNLAQAISELREKGLAE